MPAIPNSTTRFGDRVENYIKYRPHYPREVVAYLRDTFGLTPDWVVADIGSGTGFSAELFLENDNEVFCIEPNAPMREAGEEYLKARFTRSRLMNMTSIDATAERTTLADHSIDLAIAGQAFHWFDIELSRREFNRILKEGGYAALMWNDRLTKESPFLVAYEALLQKFGTDYNEIDHRNVTAEIVTQFFGNKDFLYTEFDNVQTFGYEGIEGRLLSSSYVPREGEPTYAPMLTELRKIFDETSEMGEASFLYKTEIYVGRLSA